MSDKHYFGRSKTITDESLNQYLESNKKKFTDLIGTITYYVLFQQPKSGIAEQYNKGHVSYYLSKIEKYSTNTLNDKGLREVIGFLSYTVNKEKPADSECSVNVMYQLMNECYKKFEQGIYEEVSEDNLKSNIISDLEAELVEEGHGIEGDVKYYYGKRYERDSKNRIAAIKKHGLNCFACEFNFEEMYGERGKDFIEIHHIKPLSTLEEAKEIKPETDLVPLCANCHRMVHREKDKVLSIEELQELIKKHRN